MKHLWIPLLLSLLALPPAAAQTGEDVLRFAQREPGASARMVGLAGAGIGGIADWGAAAANPAGLALVRRSHVTGSLDLTTRQNEAVSDVRLDTRANRLGPGHAAYVASIPTARGALVLGVGYHQTATLDRKLFYEQAAGAGELYESGFLGELSGVASVEVAPRIYLGGAMNLLIGDYSLARFGAGGAQAMQVQSLDTALRGFGFRGGIVAEGVPGLRLGVALESPTWLYAEETFTEGRSVPDLFNYAMQTPWRVGAGAVYEQGGVLVSADVAFADWAQARLRPSTTFSEENRAVERTFRETVDVRLGAEYDFGLGAVRAGYAYGQDPLREEVAADRTRHTVAAGLSFYAYPGVTLDFGVAFTESEDQFFPSDEAVREQLGALRVLAGIQYNLPSMSPARRR